MKLNMFNNTWNNEEYEKFIQYLESLYDENNKIFFSKTCQSQYEILGIKLPVLNKIANSISKTDISSFLKLVKYQYYEEVMIAGFVIASITDEATFFPLFNQYIKHIDCWGLCDSFCNRLKLPKIKPQKYFNLAKKLSIRPKEFISRVGLCMIIFHFVKEPFFSEIYVLLNKIESDKYYINMAEAWLICELYIENKEETIAFIKNNHLNSFTHNKSISKIKDSYRVTPQEKQYLTTLKK